MSDGLGTFAEVEFLVPVPKPRAQLSARDAFRYLVLFGTLYVAAYQFGDLLFQFVNLAIPDQLANPTSKGCPALDTMAMAIEPAVHVVPLNPIPLGSLPTDILITFMDVHSVLPILFL